MFSFWTINQSRKSQRFSDYIKCAQRKVSPLGFGKSVTRSNLSKANEVRSVEIFEQYAHKVIEIARQKKAEVSDFSLKTICMPLILLLYPFVLSRFGGHALLMKKREE